MSNTDKQLLKCIGEAAPTLVEFYRPGKDENPAVLDEIRAEMGSRVNVLQIDGTQYPDLMKAYKVATYPTFLIFKDGAVAWHDSGRKTSAELKHMLRDFI